MFDDSHFELNSELGKFKKMYQSNSQLTPETYKELKTVFSHGTKLGKTAYNMLINGHEVIDAEFLGIPRTNIKTLQICIHLKADAADERGNFVGWFHEHGHCIDIKLGGISSDPMFLNAIFQDYYNLLSKYEDPESIEAILISLREHSAVSDILEGVSGGLIRGITGHQPGYWTLESIGQETFAHMFQAQFDAVKRKIIRSFFPHVHRIFQMNLKESLRKYEKES